MCCLTQILGPAFTLGPLLRVLLYSRRVSPSGECIFLFRNPSIEGLHPLPRFTSFSTWKLRPPYFRKALANNRTVSMIPTFSQHYCQLPDFDVPYSLSSLRMTSFPDFLLGNRPYYGHFKNAFQKSQLPES